MPSGKPEPAAYVLSGESHDEDLQCLVVAEVVPAPDASRLVVTVCPFAPDDTFNPTLTLQHLHQAVGRLRSEIARSISRRKVPELVFQVVVNDPLQSSMEIRNDE